MFGGWLTTFGALKRVSHCAILTFGLETQVNSIMFKFAIDSSNLFEGDDHKASRVAGHDLLGYNCFVAAGIEEINTPLVCLLDYRGFRLVAMSLLPIGRDTLVYGSDDAGARIKTDSIVHDILLKCSQWMNTAPHDVVEMKTLHKKRLATVRLLPSFRPFCAIFMLKN